MPLIVRTTHTPLPPIQLVTLAAAQQHARDAGSPHASLQNLVGVTVPVLRVDQSGLQYEQRSAGGGTEFRFKTGTLLLTLRQQIYMVSTVPTCERTVWEPHERAHADDNVALLPQIEPAIRRDASLGTILITPQWRPRSQFQATQNAIQSGVGAIFRRLTGVAATRRDTPTEYARIRQQVSSSCP
jgi:hypothetical protein